MIYEKKVEKKSARNFALACNLQLKSLDAEGKFAGYASVFDVVDSQNDIILRGAFAKTIKGRVRDIKMLWQHRQNEPIGVYNKILEDRNGLYVEGQLLLDVARAKEVYALLKEGAVSGLSIGYTPTKFYIHPKTGVRIISEVDLWEISLVTFPANNTAKITVVKSATTLPTLKNFSKEIDRAIGTLLQ